MKYASVTYVKTLRVNNLYLRVNSVLQQGKPCSFLTAQHHVLGIVQIHRNTFGPVEVTRVIRGGTQGTRGIDLFWEQLIGSPTKNTINLEAQFEKLTKSHYYPNRLTQVQGKAL